MISMIQVRSDVGMRIPKTAKTNLLNLLQQIVCVWPFCLHSTLKPRGSEETSKFCEYKSLMEKPGVVLVVNTICPILAKNLCSMLSMIQIFTKSDWRLKQTGRMKKILNRQCV
ncbi:unnamed protein product [Macrosiphum euphorbiae]|uniref:Uncharacterized protein n=1 Tax=Macrosiphum euphorbiae TaxID=13131 RepID=A0AAV0WAX8_9HEMI|nr:unnamed protein product [Macrosiphum euphorbiae]